MSQNAGRREFLQSYFPYIECMFIDPSASVSESKRWSTQMMGVRWKEQWCYQILPLYVYSLVSAVIIYNKFINLYCSLCTKTESSSLVKCSIRFFFSSGIWEIQPRVSNWDHKTWKCTAYVNSMCYVVYVLSKHMKWAGKIDPDVRENNAIRSVFSIHISVSNCIYWKVFFSNISHGINLSQKNLSFWH